MDRYARQTILDEIGAEGQKRLSEASVLVVGAGGLGCPALLYLAAAGIGRLGIADFDVVDETNLQRQVLYSTDQIGQNKARAAQEKLQALNPTITIEIFEDGLNEVNAEELFKNHDIIIDGTDNFDTKYLINDAGVKFGKPVVYGAINQFEGQVSVFDAQKGPCYRCLYPEKPEEHVPNCAEAGVIGAVAGMIGTAQAMEVIKLVTAHENFKPLIGTLFCIDLKDMRVRMLDIEKQEDCPVCSKNLSEIELPKIAKQTSAEICAFVRNVSVGEAKSDQDWLFIDVREQEEWDEGHIEGAQLIPLSTLMEGHVPDLPKDKTILLYCRSGKRSLTAAQILNMHGYSDMLNLVGGYLEWSEAA